MSLQSEQRDAWFRVAASVSRCRSRLKNMASSIAPLVEAIRTHGRSYDPSQSTISFGELRERYEAGELAIGCAALTHAVQQAEEAEVVEVVRAGRAPRGHADLHDACMLTVRHSPWRTIHVRPDLDGNVHDIELLVDEVI